MKEMSNLRLRSEKIHSITFYVIADEQRRTQFELRDVAIGHSHHRRGQAHKGLSEYDKLSNI